MQTQGSALLRTWLFLFQIMAAIFVVETFVMVLMQNAASSMSPMEQSVLDGILLTMLLAPILFFLVVRPLMRKNAEQLAFQSNLEEIFFELKDRKSFIESVLKNIQSGIVVTDPEFRITLANQYTLDFFARESDDVIGMGLDHLCPVVYNQIMAGIDADEVSGLGLHQRTVGFKRFDLKQADGVPAGHIITFIDISEVEKVRKEMRQKERLATMGEVVARVAHEMRNPLFGISASAQILAMELPLSPEQKELMASILTEGRRMNHMVDELLDCSKEMRLKKVSFDFVKAVRDAISFNQPLILEKRLSLHKTLTEEEIPVTADPERIRQVLVNLLKNAIDAVPEGGNISACLQRLDNKVGVTIGDSGPGIPEQSLEKIFDIFYTTKKGGTGLGLPISRKIMEAHDGSLVAGNDPDGGAVFTVMLPLESCQ